MMDVLDPEIVDDLEAALEQETSQRSGIDVLTNSG